MEYFITALIVAGMGLDWYKRRKLTQSLEQLAAAANQGVDHIRTTLTKHGLGGGGK